MPKMESELDHDIRWLLFPYGMWTLSDGTRVLFNRHYSPFIKMGPDGQVSWMSYKWVDIEKTEYFYNDSLDARSINRGKRVLVEWMNRIEKIHG